MSIKNKFVAFGFDSFVNGQKAAEARLAALEAANRAAKEEALLAGHQQALAVSKAQGEEAASAAFLAGAILAAGAVVFGLFLKEEKRKGQARLERDAEEKQRKAEEEHVVRAAQLAREQASLAREESDAAVRALEMEVRRREAQARLDALDKRENNSKA